MNEDIINLIKESELHDYLNNDRISEDTAKKLIDLYCKRAPKNSIWEHLTKRPVLSITVICSSVSTVNFDHLVTYHHDGVIWTRPYSSFIEKYVKINN